jgi:hypothetical protein
MSDKASDIARSPGDGAVDASEFNLKLVGPQRQRIGTRQLAQQRLPDTYRAVSIPLLIIDLGTLPTTPAFATNEHAAARTTARTQNQPSTLDEDHADGVRPVEAAKRNKLLIGLSGGDVGAHDGQRSNNKFRALPSDAVEQHIIELAQFRVFLAGVDPAFKHAPD